MIVNATRVQYRPHDAAYRLDVEVIRAKALRDRVASDPQRGFERVAFQCLLFVRSGSYTHTIDFETHQCTAGSCLLIGPGQVHRFGPPSDWDGWILIVAPHHVPHEIERLPPHIRATDGVVTAIVELFSAYVPSAFSSETMRPLSCGTSGMVVDNVSNGPGGNGMSDADAALSDWG